MLSCRVIGRGAEAVLLNKLAASAKDMGAGVLVGEYIPSERNMQVADLYTRFGFTGPKTSGGVQRWTWALEEGLPQVPDWIKVVDRDGEGG
jgi:predicted enzyme involved in methoxymalonyl-ACP biosynthesis